MELISDLHTQDIDSYNRNMHETQKYVAANLSIRILIIENLTKYVSTNYTSKGSTFVKLMPSK
jgi:hypothetical protein